MIAGLPGTGLGGLFYLAAALVMIVRGSVQALRGKSERIRWKTIVPMGVITLGILSALWATYWVLGELMTLTMNHLDTDANPLPVQTVGVFHLPAVFIVTLPIQAASLVTLLTVVELIHLLMKNRNRKKKLESSVAQRDNSSLSSAEPVFVENTLSGEESKVIRQ